MTTTRIRIIATIKSSKRLNQDQKVEIAKQMGYAVERTSHDEVESHNSVMGRDNRLIGVDVCVKL